MKNEMENRGSWAIASAKYSFADRKKASESKLLNSNERLNN